MNKKYLNYGVLAMLLVVYKPSFPMQVKLALATTSVVSGSLYGLFRIADFLEAKYKVKSYEDVAPETQEWARKELCECGIKNADTVPLKKAQYGDGWNVYQGCVFIPKKFDPVNCSEIERLKGASALKHEMKHLNNHDISKISTLFGTIYGTPVLLSVNKLPKIQVLRAGMAAVLAGMTTTVYSRYQEGEADRFAYKNARSREELVVAKNHYQDSADRFERYMKDKNLYKLYANGGVGKGMLSSLSQKLNNVESQLYDADNSSKIESLKNRKKILLKMANFISDWEHPARMDRAAMAQESIDEWDKKL